MSATDDSSALDFTPVYVIGAPRSGTTWIQNMLGSHPAVCAPQETGLFHSFLSVWQAKWDQELADSSRPDARRRGLASVLTTEQFTGLLRRNALDVYRAALHAKPGASVLLDKEPSNTLHTPLVVEVFPEARFIHLVRDGRDVAASMVAAHEGWARDWAPATVADAARSWRQHVAAGRRAGDLGRPYLEVRYEDLLAEPVDRLLELFAFAGVDSTRAEGAATAEEFSFDRVSRDGGGRSGIAWGGEISRSGAVGEPKGFYRKGAAGGWRDEWSTFQQAEFDRVAGDLLVETGYESSRDWWEPTPMARVGRAGGAARDRAREAAKSRIRRWVARHPSLREG